jgi:hypothetical protein
MALQDGMKQGELQIVQSVVTNESMRRLEMKIARKGRKINENDVSRRAMM